MLSKRGLKRDCIDKFYTKPDIAQKCVDYFHHYVKVKKSDVVIEPSAGSGSFSSLLSRHRLLAYDLRPESDGIQEQDFLALNTSFLSTKRVHVIGNPPFGRQASLAKKFISKSVEFAHTISFILPKSFKKESFMNTFPRTFHLIFSYDLPKNSFTLEDSDYDVPCVFQVWERKDTERTVEEVVIPSYYTYIKKDQNPTLSFRRVGVNAGVMSTTIDDKSVQSHYFILLNDGIDPDTFLERYRENIKFEFDNTVGPKSVSKKELDRKLQNLF